MSSSRQTDPANDFRRKSSGSICEISTFIQSLRALLHSFFDVSFSVRLLVLNKKKKPLFLISEDNKTKHHLTSLNSQFCIYTRSMKAPFVSKSDFAAHVNIIPSANSIIAPNAIKTLQSIFSGTLKQNLQLEPQKYSLKKCHWLQS